MEKILLLLTHSHWQSLQFLAIWPFESKFSLKINLILPLSCGPFLTISPNFHSLEFSIFLSGFHQALRPKFGHFFWHNDSVMRWHQSWHFDILTFDRRTIWHEKMTSLLCDIWHLCILPFWHCDRMTSWFMTLRPDCSAWIFTPRGTGRLCLHSLQLKKPATATGI